MIQIGSAKAPFTSPRVAFQAVTAFGRADAMGLLPTDEHIETLDFLFPEGSSAYSAGRRRPESPPGP